MLYLFIKYLLDSVSSIFILNGVMLYSFSKLCATLKSHDSIPPVLYSIATTNSTRMLN